MASHHINNKEFYESLPKKRIGVTAVISYRHQYLVLKPSYVVEPLDNPQARNWVLPGGIVEAEESPLEGLHREIKMQLGLSINPLRLMSVDYIHNIDSRGEYLQFLFEVQELNESEAQSLQLDKIDFKDFEFMDLEKAIILLTLPAARRLEKALLAQQVGLTHTYLEDGHDPYDQTTLT